MVSITKNIFGVCSILDDIVMIDTNQYSDGILVIRSYSCYPLHWSSFYSAIVDTLAENFMLSSVNMKSYVVE